MSLQGVVEFESFSTDMADVTVGCVLVAAMLFVLSSIFKRFSTVSTLSDCHLMHLAHVP